MKEGSSLPSPTEPTKEEAEALTENGSHEDPDDIKIYVEKPQQPKRHSEQEQNYRNYNQKIRHSKTLVTHISTLTFYSSPWSYHNHICFPLLSAGKLAVCFFCADGHDAFTSFG